MNLKPNQLFKLALCILIVFPMVFWLPYGTHRVVKIMEMLAFLYLAMEVYSRSVAFSLGYLTFPKSRNELQKVANGRGAQ